MHLNRNWTTLLVAIIGLIFASAVSLSAEIRIFAMPGGEIYGDAYGWSVTGGVGLEGKAGLPWSFGLWYGYSTATVGTFQSIGQQGGFWAGIPLGAKGMPVAIVPMLYAGAKMNTLQTGDNSSLPTWGGVIEPGMELRLGFLRPLEICLYGGCTLSYFSDLTTRSFHGGVSLALVIPDFAAGKPNSFIAKDDIEISASNTVVVTVTVTNKPAADTNLISSTQDEFAREIQEVLAAGQAKPTNAVTSTNTISNTAVTNVTITGDKTNTNVVVTVTTNTAVEPVATAVSNDNAPALEKNNDELVIRFSEVLFDKGSTKLGLETANLVRKLGITFRKYPKLLIMVEGHTDNQGSSDYNLDLSEKRAKAVTEELYKGGVPRKQVRFQGFGDTDPVVANDTEDNRKKNRRVNIRLLFPEGQK